MKAIVYNKKTGDLLYLVEASEASLASYDTILTGVLTPSATIDLETNYFKDGEFKSRPKKPAAWYMWDGEKWVNTRTADEEWSIIREKRNELLANSDWTQLPDVPLATKEAWAIYRQQLRDITEQPDPFNITWPVPPA